MIVVFRKSKKRPASPPGSIINRMKYAKSQDEKMVDISKKRCRIEISLARCFNIFTSEYDILYDVVYIERAIFSIGD